MRRFLFLLSLFLCGLIPTQAQNKKSVAPTSQSRPPASNSPKSNLGLLAGIGLGGLLLGGALGFALKKPSAAPQTKDELAPLLDQAPFPLAVIDEREKVVKANAAFSQFLGAPQVVGTSFPDFFHPDDLARAKSQLHDIFGGDRASTTLDCRFFRPDGTLLHAVLSANKRGEARKPNEVFLSLADATERVTAQSELVGGREAIHALYQVISGDKTQDLDSKIKSLLMMGCGRFELPVGVLGRLSSEGFETLFVQSSDRRIRPAMTVGRDKADSIEGRLLGIATLPNASNWSQFPFIVSPDATYLGAPILVNNALFGMISFSGIEPRSRPFEAQDAELLQLMAQWVGGEIERDNARVALERQQQELLEFNAQLEALATHDPLTGAKNRRAFNEKLDEEWSRARRYGTSLSLVLMDVDKFKQYNDSFGHPAGDEVLRRVSNVIMAAVRTTDFFARYGGEEFVLLLPNTDDEGALILAERLRQKIEAAPWKERAITASMGVSSLAQGHKNAPELTQSADDALYKSKENGRNRVTHARELAAFEFAD